jgi:hypothetical protein
MMSNKIALLTLFCVNLAKRELSFGEIRVWNSRKKDLRCVVKSRVGIALISILMWEYSD